MATEIMRLQDKLETTSASSLLSSSEDEQRKIPKKMNSGNGPFSPRTLLRLSGQEYPPSGTEADFTPSGKSDGSALLKIAIPTFPYEAVNPRMDHCRPVDTINRQKKQIYLS